MMTWQPLQNLNRKLNFFSEHSFLPLFFINKTLSVSLWAISQTYIFSRTTESGLNWHFIQLTSPVELGCFTGKAIDLPFSIIAFGRMGVGGRGSPQKINENASLHPQAFSKFIIFFLGAKSQKEYDAHSKCIQNNYSNFYLVIFQRCSFPRPSYLMEASQMNGRPNHLSLCSLLFPSPKLCPATSAPILKTLEGWNPIFYIFPSLLRSTGTTRVVRVCWMNLCMKEWMHGISIHHCIMACLW